MNKKQIIELAKTILAKLQKRNGLKVYDNHEVVIHFRRNVYHFTVYQLYFSIALVLKNFHSIPQNYLEYYIRSVVAKNTAGPTKIQLEIMGEMLKGFHSHKTLMAGGSMAETFLIKRNDKNIIIKKATGLPSRKLSNELNFLIKLSNNHKIATHIPEILDFKRNNQSILVVLRYYPANTLAHEILFGKIDKKRAWERVEEVLDFVMSNLWTTEKSTKTENYINSYFLQRIRKSIDSLIKKAPTLSRLAMADKVIINGSTYLNLLKIVDVVEKDKELIKMLTPPFICNIWGDLHPNNILLAKNNFILIDPRGDLGDPIYDLGKMYHTFGPGRYDFVDNDLYDVMLEDKNGIPVIKRKFLTEHPSWVIYDFLQRKFENNIEKFVLPGDIFWKLRWDFLNFCIYSTMPPFLVGREPMEERAIMGYSNALIFGKRFLKSLKERI